MIQTDYYMTRSDGVVLNRTYSDKDMKIERDGVQYSEAIDPAELGRQYTETDEPIEKIDMPMQYEGVSDKDRIAQMEIENADLIKQVEALQQQIDELTLENGGSVLPGHGVDKPPTVNTPTKGGGLTLG